VLLLSACVAFGEAEPPAPGTDEPTDEPCPAGAFCDGFDEGTIDGRPGWTGVNRTDGALVVLDASDPFRGKASLSTHVTGPGGGQRAFLSLKPLAPGMAETPSPWRSDLRFRMRLDSFNQSYVGGPRILVEDGSGVGRVSSVGVAISNFGNLIVEQFTNVLGCDGCGRNVQLEPLVMDHWYDIALLIEATDAAAPPFGTLRITFEGKTIETDLTVPLVSRSAELRFGISHGIAAAQAVMRLDDMVFVPR
jgi:hypothetical protein